ncbi:GNAT family N-acetyltransferase [Marinilactibacillus kalidii]|uniref:GNAT family N-acetyltransferase n=1 Tax=Marinilactibacillus kalidii TaxID=2820274 RepID=UPI001ABDBFC2|nr:GNAT family N-acetyltransferase [Marinilactibacillus kalidii]
MNTILIKKITTEDSEYQGSLRLREQVLRKPLGIRLEDEAKSSEETAHHFVALYEQTVVGTLFLIETEESVYQMRQVAVDQAYQGKATGKQLVKVAEKWADNAGVKKIWMHARENAWPFYESLGYHYTSDDYMQIGIVHKTMEKSFINKKE